MSEFGKLYFPHWLRGRLLLTALALVVALGPVWVSPAPPSAAMAIVFGVNLAMS